MLCLQLYSPSASDVKSFYEQKNWRGVEVTDTKAPEVRWWWR